MNRFSFARGSAVAALATILVAATLVGCNMLSVAAYIMHDDNLPPEYTGSLVGKRIAVVCRPVCQLEYADASAGPDLAAMVGDLLGKNIKCTIVPPSDVAMWADSNNWDTYAEIGRAMKADIVIGIDLENFTLYEGTTLYQGRADVHIWVHDLHSGKSQQVVWNKKLPRTVYPPMAAVPISEKSDDTFRREYLGVLSDHIARLFYPHGRLADFASDADSM